MIEILQGYPDNVLAISGKGVISAEDYRSVLVPAVEKALERHRKVRLLYRIGPDCTGFEPGAMWEDFRVGVEHLTRWERVAVVTDTEWIRHTMSAIGFLIPIDMRVFALAESDAARDWITAD